MYLEILWIPVIQGIQLRQCFLIYLAHHLHLVSLKAPPVPFALMVPCVLDHRLLQVVLEVQLDQVCRLVQEVLLLQTPPLSQSACPEVLFFHQTFQPSQIPDPLGVTDVLVVLVHRADLEFQALHHNLQGPAVQAVHCFHEVLFLLESREVP